MAVHDNYMESGDVFVSNTMGQSIWICKLLGLLGNDKEGFGHFKIGVDNENEEDGEAQ